MIHCSAEKQNFTVICTSKINGKTIRIDSLVSNVNDIMAHLISNCTVNGAHIDIYPHNLTVQFGVVQFDSNTQLHITNNISKIIRSSVHLVGFSSEH